MKALAVNKLYVVVNGGCWFTLVGRPTCIGSFGATSYCGVLGPHVIVKCRLSWSVVMLSLCLVGPWIHVTSSSTLERKHKCDPMVGIGSRILHMDPATLARPGGSIGRLGDLHMVDP